MRGLFITFEGIDGCGKTTQLNLLAEYIKNSGRESLVTREPGAKGLGEKIREILLHYEGEIAPKAESFLFLADRAQHVDIVIKRAVEKGTVVLCDRYIDSTVAYQGYGRQGDIEHLKKMNALATGSFMPDLTFVFDIDAETSLKRVGSQKDRLEKAGIEFFERVRSGYLELAEQNPERIKVINSNDSIENIFEQVKSYIEKVL